MFPPGLPYACPFCTTGHPFHERCAKLTPERLQGFADAMSAGEEQRMDDWYKGRQSTFVRWAIGYLSITETMQNAGIKIGKAGDC